MKEVVVGGLQQQIPCCRRASLGNKYRCAPDHEPFYHYLFCSKPRKVYMKEEQPEIT